MQRYVFNKNLSFRGNVQMAKFCGYKWNPSTKEWISHSPEKYEIHDILDNGYAIVKKDGGLLVALVDFDNRNLAKEQGFTWDRENKVWKSEIHENVEDVVFSHIKEDPVSDSILKKKGVTTPLYDFQKKAVAKMVAAGDCYNASDMGNGKTLMAIAAASLLKKEGDNIVVVCPASLKLNWKKEFIKHTTINEDSIFVSGIDKPKEYKSDKHKIIIINYEVINKNHNILDMSDILILDEAHYIKNYNAKRTQAILDNTKNTRHIFLLSGTPVTKSSLDLYPALKLIGVVDQSFYSFASTFAIKTQKVFRGRNVTRYTGFKNEKLLRSKMYPFYLRYEAKEVNLPSLRRQTIPTKATKTALYNLEKAYKELEKRYFEKNGCPLDVKKAIKEGNEDVAFISLKKAYSVTKTTNTVQVVKDILEDEDKRVVVFSDHIDSVNDIAKALHLSKKRIGVICGSTPQVERDRIVEDFQEGKIDALVGTSAISTGLTLTRADTLVINDASWNVATNEQLYKRIHRIGQEKPCVIYNITIGLSDYTDMPDFDTIISELCREKTKTIKATSH